MLAEINGYSCLNRQVWVLNSHGGWSWLVLLLCFATYNQQNRPCSRSNENYNNSLDRPITAFRPRYDTITTESEHCLGVERR